MTAKDLIKRALTKIGVIATGETPSSDEITDGLLTLNDLISEWSGSGMGEFVNSQVTHSLVSGTGSYSIGSGGDIDVTRPELILSAFIRNSSGTDRDITILSRERYNSIPNKTYQGTPDSVFYDATMATGTLYFHPVPDGDFDVHLNVSSPISEIQSINTELSSLFPRDYLTALVWALAVELCPEYGKQVDGIVLGKAASTRDAVEANIFSRKVEPANISQLTGL